MQIILTRRLRRFFSLIFCSGSLSRRACFRTDSNSFFRNPETNWYSFSKEWLLNSPHRSSKRGSRCRRDLGAARGLGTTAGFFDDISSGAFFFFRREMDFSWLVPLELGASGPEDVQASIYWRCLGKFCWGIYDYGSIEIVRFAFTFKRRWVTVTSNNRGQSSAFDIIWSARCDKCRRQPFWLQFEPFSFIHLLFFLFIWKLSFFGIMWRTCLIFGNCTCSSDYWSSLLVGSTQIQWNLGRQVASKTKPTQKSTTPHSARFEFEAGQTNQTRSHQRRALEILFSQKPKICNKRDVTQCLLLWTP